MLIRCSRLLKGVLKVYREYILLVYEDGNRFGFSEMGW